MGDRGRVLSLSSQPLQRLLGLLWLQLLLPLVAGSAVHQCRADL
jgi:hypothetical protein